MDSADNSAAPGPSEVPGAVVSRAHRLIRRLLWFYGASALIVVLYGALAYWPPGWLPLYYSNVIAQGDIDRLGQALRQWAERHRLQLGEICWVGGRNEAIVSGTPPRAPRQPQEDRAQQVEP